MRPLDPYLCDRHLAFLAAGASPPAVLCDEGTLLFFDISGFTPLTERLARHGKAGVEELITTLNGVIAPLVRTAAALGGDVLKFGGDALLLLFTDEGHEARGCAAAWDLQAAMAPFKRLRTSAGVVALRASAGVASGPVHTFFVGDRFCELVVAGPTTSAVMGLEATAEAGEVLVGPRCAERLDPEDVGAAKGDGRLLRRRPAVGPRAVVAPGRGDAAAGLPAALRRHLGPDAESEHRQVTVAFAQFRGLDELLERDGEQAAAEALHGFMVGVQAACERHDVTFLATDADRGAGKVFLVAGAPTAGTDDEDRMLQALRAIVEAAEPLRVRAGANRGRAFAVHLGAEDRRTYTTMGDTTNLAARVMGKAPDGGVLATTSVLERLRAPFDLEPVAPFAVKGKSAPVDAVLVGPLCVAQDDAREVRETLVGREAERAALGEALARARHGEGGVVELVGEPGLGKSALVADLRARAGLLGVRTLVVEGGAYARSTPWFALRRPLRALLGAPGADDGATAAALDAAVRRHLPGAAGLLPLLGRALGLELPGTPETARLAPATAQERMHVLLDALLAALLPPRATLLVVEDAQWLDEASSDLLRTVLRRAPARGWAAVVTRRPGAGGLDDLPGTPLRLTLGGLDDEAARALALAAGGRALPPHALAEVVERAGGSPLFVRELAGAARRGAVVEDLPATVEALLTARIDVLPPAERRLLRRAAVLGQQFPAAWLRAIAGEDEAALAASLRSLDAFLTTEPGTVRFRQALTRQAAYETLPYGARRDLHRRAGELIEAELGDAAETKADILALHFGVACEHERAWRYGRAAGDRARAAFANADAARLYARALEAARALGRRDAEVRDVWEARAEAHAMAGEPEAAGRALTAARRLARDDVLVQARLVHRRARLCSEAGRLPPAARCLRTALELLEGRSDREAGARRAHVIATLASLRQRQGRMTEAAALARDAMARAEEVGADEALAQACYTLDWALVESGAAEPAVHSGRALEIYRRLGDLEREAVVLNNLGGFAYREGRWDDAVALYRHAAAASARAGDMVGTAFGDCNVGEVRSDQGRWEEARTHLQHALDTFVATGADQGAAYVTALLGRLDARAGRHAQAEELLLDAAGRFRAQRAAADLLWAEVLLPEAWLLAGRSAEALARVGTLLEAHAAGRFAATLHRVRGCALAREGDADAGTAVLEVALVTAREIGDDLELALALDALLALGGAPVPISRRRRRERDAVAERLGLLRLPPTGLAVAGEAEAAPA